MTAEPGAGPAPGHTERPREAPQPDQAQPGQAQPGTPTPPGYLAQPLGTFLDGLAARTAAPAGGSAAALTVALAAALCAKTARLSARQLTAERAGQLTTLAERIRAAAASLIDADALAYRAVIEQTRHAAGSAPACTALASSKPGDPKLAGQEAVAGNADLAAALSAASDVPMRVIALAAEAAELATELAIDGNQALRGDAITAALLAESGARSAATLLSINLAGVPRDPRHSRTTIMLSRISRLVDQATAVCGRPV